MSLQVVIMVLSDSTNRTGAPIESYNHSHADGTKSNILKYRLYFVNNNSTCHPMHCKKCNKSLLEESQFCMYCGHPVNESTSPSSESAPAAAPVSQPSVTSFASTPTQSAIPPSYDQPRQYDTRWNYQKHDEPYEKPHELAFVGIIFIFINLVIALSTRGSTMLFSSLLSVILVIVVRAVGCPWVAKVAREQNRDVAGWVIFTLFFPTIAMIIMGFQRKLYAYPEVNPQFDDIENARRIYNKAVKFYQRNRYQESYRFALKALELDPHSAEVQELLNALYDHVHAEPVTSSL